MKTQQDRKPHLKTQIVSVLLSIAADANVAAQFRLEALERLNELRNERRHRRKAK